MKMPRHMWPPKFQFSDIISVPLSSASRQAILEEPEVHGSFVGDYLDEMTVTGVDDEHHKKGGKPFKGVANEPDKRRK